MQATPITDFAVVGAGLTGVAIAYGLARLGQSVVVLERLDQSQLLDQPSHGLLWAQGNLGKSEVQREWNNLALSRWREFDEQLCQISASTTQYERPGGVWLADDALALQGRQQRAQAGAADDPELEWLDQATLKRLVHQLSDEVFGASYCADDGQLNLKLLYRAFNRALENLNVELSTLSTVEGVREQGDVYQVWGDGFELSARQVILATGGQSDAMHQSLGFNPLRTLVETLWETQPVRNFLPFPSWQLRQARDGSLIVPVGDGGEQSESWQTALRAYPALAQLALRKTWRDTQCETMDDLPQYQRSPQCQGVFRVASPHSLLHCPLHASLIPAWLLGKLSDEALGPLLQTHAYPSSQQLSVPLDLQDSSLKTRESGG